MQKLKIYNFENNLFCQSKFEIRLFQCEKFYDIITLRLITNILNFYKNRELFEQNLQV